MGTTPPTRGVARPASNGGYKPTTIFFFLLYFKISLDNTDNKYIIEERKGGTMQANIEHIINSPDATKFEGTSTIFIQLDNDWGIKLFEHRERRDNTYEVHEIYLLHGLAPNLGPKVTVDYKGKTRYGYLTEVVKCCDKAVQEYFGIDFGNKCCGTNQDGNSYFNYCSSSLYIEFLTDTGWGKLFEELNEKTREAKLYYNDDHAGNWGVRKNGTPVFIDFDKERL